MCGARAQGDSDLLQVLLPLAVGLGVIQRPLPHLLLVGREVRRRHAAAIVMERGRGGRRVRGADPGAGQTSLPLDGLLHAQVQGAVLIHLDVHFLEDTGDTQGRGRILYLINTSKYERVIKGRLQSLMKCIMSTDYTFLY